MEPLLLSGTGLSLGDAVEVGRLGRTVGLASDAVQAIDASAAVVAESVARQEVVYGVTTGFGKFADRVIPTEAVLDLQRNLLRSHSVGVGNPFAEDVTRVMLLLRINSLALGASGIRLGTLERLVEMLNSRVIPVVPEKGSVGASGDLAPLAHLSLPLIGEGIARFEGEVLDGAEAMKRAGLAPIQLGPKEGLALINGTQAMTAMGALCLSDALTLCKTADVVGALTLEAVRGTNRSFDARIQNLRPHPGQIASASNLRTLTADSALMKSHRHDPHKVQDPYSLRCMPQVHGATRDVVNYAVGVVEIEMNSATDNPLVFASSKEVISGGNFHGQPVGIAMDAAAIGISELADISERRIEAMLDPSFSELPPFLTRHGGVDSGYMVSQYTAAALVSENKVLSHPATVDSIPTSANQEDHVSMGTLAARKAAQILENSQIVLAIELLCAAEGLDYRRPLRSTAALEAVHDCLRQQVAHLDDDRVMAGDIQVALDLIRSGRVLQAAEAKCGRLE